MRFIKQGIFLFWIGSLLITGVNAAKLPKVKPEKVGMSSARLKRLDALMAEALAARDFPGAVLLVARKGRIVYRKAFGDAQWLPRIRPMKVNCIFDLASLTKPVATATSMMVLVERGEISLWSPVKDFFPDWAEYPKEEAENETADSQKKPDPEARLWHLLTHTSGLPPYLETEEVVEICGDPCDVEKFIQHIIQLEKLCPPGDSFIYSDLGYILLASILEKETGLSLAEFTQKHIFRPLKMSRTFFNPPEAFRELLVPTEIVDGILLMGEVHDPRARLMGGVAGHAGLFSTADDLAVFAQMLLNKGEYRGKRILSPLTVERMTEVFPFTYTSGRGLGWDLDSPFSSNGGDLFGAAAFGHTGFTGTSLWIDPETSTFVIFLTNRVHPDNTGTIATWRSKVANAAAAAVIKK